MQNNKLIHIDILTPSENTAYNLNGAGLQVKEIADKMGIAYETAKSYMKSIKEKLCLSKDKEVTAHFWCKMLGSDFDEVKKKILATCLLFVFLLYIPYNQQMASRNRFTNRARITVVARRYNYTA